MRTSAVSCFLALAVAAVACTAEREAASTDSARGASTEAQVVAGTFTIVDFQRLRWIEGRWRGFQPDGKTFFEQYRFLNDSTFVMHAFPDSAFRAPRDSSRIELRGGTVANEGGSARWVATRLDSTGVDFAPHHGATNHFTWAREDSTKWNATLRSTDQDGRPQTVVYALHKFGR
jgi:hypothetical protein